MLLLNSSHSFEALVWLFIVYFGHFKNMNIPKTVKKIHEMMTS